MSQSELFELTPEEAAELQATAEHLHDPDIRAKWPRSLAEHQDVLTAVLVADGIDPARAVDLAAKQVITLARHIGAQQHYLPNNDALDTAVRDRRAFQRWMRGLAKPDELAEEMGVTYQRVMQILAAQRSLWRKRHEPELPLQETES